MLKNDILDTAGVPSRYISRSDLQLQKIIRYEIKKVGPAILYIARFPAGASLSLSLSPITREGNRTYLFVFESRASACFCLDRVLADFRSNLERQKTDG